MSAKTKRSERQSGNLLIRGGRIIDPSQGIDAVGDLFISEGKIAWLSTQQAGPLPDN